MNRAERRRMQREQQRPSGTAYNPASKPRRDSDYEPDAPGRHVWIATSVHRVSEAGAYRSLRPGESVLLDQESVIDVMVGCFVCERSIYEIEQGSVCPGEPKR